MNSRQFKLHIAALLERKRQEEAQQGEPTKLTKPPRKVNPPVTQAVPPAKKPPASQVPTFMFRVRRSRGK